MACHLGTLISGEGSPQSLGHRGECAEERVVHRGGVAPGGEVEEHDVAAVPLDQGPMAERLWRPMMTSPARTAPSSQ